ncbi:phosphoglucomutase [Thermosphaera chiliense]|uniref:Phosphoglucomutase n=1 Tax=Thermosphaera chiliense TaxID=3402707 RepID=A0A7M1UPF5_9CREN|nr:phosphoglucomutase [Thermosphaera aggregans]QOR94120.1 phosphoglucomutase [Thermosphaera aggregans]
MKLFGTAGIRLQYPMELDGVLAYKLGLTMGSLGYGKDFFIVHDTRTTSQLLTYAFTAGVMASGGNTRIVGVAPTPLAAYSARKYKGVGVSVTASHNPPDYNGFKFYDKEGYEFTRKEESEIERNIWRKAKPVDWHLVGKAYRERAVVEEYVEDLISFVGSSPGRGVKTFVIDCANGASYNISPRIIRSLGGRPLTINCNPDGFFPFRTPEPRKDVLEEYATMFRGVSPSAIFAHDGDADRLAVIDPVDGFVKQDRILAFFAKKALEDKTGRVVVSIDTGRALDEVVEREGGVVERYVLGKTHERVKEVGASQVVMAGEPWKLIYTSWGPWVDGILQVAILTSALIREGVTRISKLLEKENIPDYPWDRRSYIISPLDIRENIYNSLIEEMKSLLGDPENIITIDGTRLEYADESWVLIRKSGTERKIRVYAEALNKGRLEEMLMKIEKKLVEIVNKMGGRVVEITYG